MKSDFCHFWHKWSPWKHGLDMFDTIDLCQITQNTKIWQKITFRHFNTFMTFHDHRIHGLAPNHRASPLLVSMFWPWIYVKSDKSDFCRFLCFGHIFVILSIFGVPVWTEIWHICQYWEKCPVLRGHKYHQNTRKWAKYRLFVDISSFVSFLSFCVFLQWLWLIEACWQSLHAIHLSLPSCVMHDFML